MILKKFLEFALTTKYSFGNISFSRIKLISVFNHFLCIILLLILLTHVTQFFFKSFLFSLTFLFMFYWFVSIFVYLYKKSQYGVYTRIIQRFWKRSLYLFWLIEVSLFCIYLFLTLISPQEVAYMLDENQLFFFFNGGQISFFQSVLYVTILILLTNVYIMSHKFNTFIWYLPIIIFILLINALYLDFIQFYCINQHYSSFNWTRARGELKKDVLLDDTLGYDNASFGIWELETSDLKMRTVMHYLFLLIFLKLWHTLFITMYFIFFENIRLQNNTISYNSLSSILQNFYFLMFFNYILKITLLKHYGLYLGEYIYYWFNVNYHFYDLTSFTVLNSFQYIIFIYYDLIIFFF